MPGPFVPVRPGTRSLPGTPEGSVAVPPEHPDPPARRRTIPQLGPLAQYAEDPAVTDLLLDGRGVLWRDSGDGVRPVDGAPALERAEARRIAVALVAAGGRHLDDATPCVDVRLAGLRVHAVLPPVSTAGPLLSIRIGRAEPWRLADLISTGAVGTDDGARLRDAVLRRRNLLICGPAGSGKTSLLAALLAEAPPEQRIVTIEDVAELAVDHPHVVGLEARQPNSDGAGGIGLSALVREALRMRPDRLVVGECRGAEVVELLMAMNTGHDGAAGTVHCSHPSALGARLEALGALGGLGPEALRAQAVAAIDLVVQLGRVAGRRRVVGIGRLALDDGGALAVVHP